MYTDTEYQEIQQRLAYFFLDELEQITQTYNLSGDAIRQALNQFELEWEQLRQLWERLIISGTSADIELCAKLVEAFQPYFLIRVSLKHIVELLEQTLNRLAIDIHQTTRLSVLFLLGTAHRMKTEYEPMINCFEEARQLAQAENNYWYLNEIENKLSHYHLENARYDEALSHANRVIERNSGATEKQRAAATLSVANVLTNRKEFAEAEAHFLHVLAYFEPIQDWNGIMHTHVNLGRLFAESSRYDMAIHHYQKSLDINNRILKNKQLGATVLFNLSIAMNRSGRYDETLEFAKQSLTEYTAIGDKWGVSRAMSMIGIAYLRQEEHEDADAIFHELIDINYKIGFTSSIIFIVANRVQNWNMAGKYEEARTVLQKHLPDILTIQSDARPRLRLVGLTVWTLAGLGLQSQLVIDLLAFLRENIALDWEIGSFIENIERQLGDVDTSVTTKQDLSTEDALRLLAKFVSSL